MRLKIVVRDPLGLEQQFEIERLWLLVIIDVFSRAVLGYNVCLGREYSRYDVIRTIEAALEPHRPRHFTLPGVGYGALGGFPSGKLPELGYATWRWFKLDNAKANLADDVCHALAEFIGCFIDAGPTRAPDDRPYVERFFGSVAANLSSRQPGYTGANARDVRRALADPKGDLQLFVSLDDIEQLLEAALAIYNASPHDGLNGRTLLEGLFEADEVPRVAADLDELDLGGHGIRGLSYVPSIGEYLVISGPVSGEPGQFALWLRNGQQGGAARRVTVPGLRGLERAEGVSPAAIDGLVRIIIVSDDGNRKAERSASYLLLDLDQLQTAP